MRSDCARRNWLSDCNIPDDFFMRLPDRFFWRETTRARPAGIKIPRPLTRERRRAENQEARLFPHPVFGETVARAPNAGLDERVQAGLLASRSSYWLRLTAKKCSGS